MQVWNAQKLARSLAGHDKEELFLVIMEDKDWVWLCDGKRRKLDKLKKKKKIHVQIIKNLPDQLLEKMNRIECDAHVRKILAAYSGSEKKENQAEN